MVANSGSMFAVCAANAGSSGTFLGSRFVAVAGVAPSIGASGYANNLKIASQTGSRTTGALRCTDTLHDMARSRVASPVGVIGWRVVK